MTRETNKKTRRLSREHQSQNAAIIDRGDARPGFSKRGFGYGFGKIWTRIETRRPSRLGLCALRGPFDQLVREAKTSERA